MNVPLFDLRPQYAIIRDEVRAALDRIFDTQQFVLRPEGDNLEDEVARYCQTKFAVSNEGYGPVGTYQFADDRRGPQSVKAHRLLPLACSKQDR